MVVVVKKSTEYTRQQLIGMIAALQGLVLDMIHDPPPRTGAEQDNIDDIRAELEETVFDTVESDLVDGGFDTSWRKELK